MKRLAIAVIACALLAAPAAGQHDHGSTTASAPEAPPPLFDGLSALTHKVTTSVPQAQKYFDQGLRLAYAFNHDEAGRAFREAARLDPDCAMAYWGQALVLGPNINLPMSVEAETAAYAAILKAQERAAKASEPERAYIAALARRYDAVAGMNRAGHDSSYADGMRNLAKQYPQDVDATVLCAEALMDLRPWDLWKKDGTPQPGTDEIVALLEKTLRAHPDHIGAIHLYIHAVEASPNPGRATPYADRLAKLAPAAGHLVHMPTHIHLRTGRYEDAQLYNARAIAADRMYIGQEKTANTYTLMYYPHNIHMRWSALSMQGRRRDALDAARELDDAVPDSVLRAMPMAEFFRVAHSLTQVRFGLWEEILREQAPPSGMPLRAAAWHYARGMAFAAKEDTKQASAERDSVSAIAGSLTDDVYFSLNPAAPVFRFAAMLLSGEIMARSGRADEAVVLLTQAAGMQDSLRYDEPPPWNATARQSLGAVLLAAGRAQEAEAVYREDLARYPENGWSLYGLTQALRAQKRKKDATATEKRFHTAWAHADVTLAASRY